MVLQLRVFPHGLGFLVFGPNQACQIGLVGLAGWMLEPLFSGWHTGSQLMPKSFIAHMRLWFSLPQFFYYMLASGQFTKDVRRQLRLWLDAAKERRTDDILWFFRRSRCVREAGHKDHVTRAQKNRFWFSCHHRSISNRSPNPISHCPCHYFARIQ